MKKLKTVRSLVTTAVQASFFLTQSAETWAAASVVEMNAFGDNSPTNVLYLDNKVIGRLGTIGKNGKIYIHIDAIKPLGYTITKSRSQIEISGVNNLSIDPMTLKFKIREVQLEVDAIQADGSVYVTSEFFTDIMGAGAIVKDGSLWLTTPGRKFSLVTGTETSTIFSYHVKNNSLYVPKFALLLALPSFKIDKDGLFDQVTGKGISLTDYEDNGRFSIMQVVKAVDGSYTMNKPEGIYALTINHESTEFVEATKQELNFAKSLATIPSIQTDSLEEAILHEINAYRTISGKASVVEGDGNTVKGSISLEVFVNAAKTIYIAMASKENRELFLGEIKSILVKIIEGKIHVEAFSS